MPDTTQETPFGAVPAPRATMGSDMVGRVVGRYEIICAIGRGAMATVYLARQTDLDREVVLKELDPVGPGVPAIVASRFVREARLAGSLSHANIVTVFEYFEAGGRPYIAMEHLEGGSLRDHLTGISLAQVVGVLDGLLAALSHSEARGIVHRDIKPENILVTGEGRVKIADFGIAKAYSAANDASLTAAGAVVGTPLYMAPEQGSGGTLTISADLYAVGVVAFEMLFGYVPFGSGEEPLEVVRRHVHEPVPDPSALRPELDPRLCRWLEQLLAKDPRERPASALVAREELEEIALAVVGDRWRRTSQLRLTAQSAPSARAPVAPVTPPPSAPVPRAPAGPAPVTPPPPAPAARAPAGPVAPPPPAAAPGADATHDVRPPRPPVAREATPAPFAHDAAPPPFARNVAPAPAAANPAQRSRAAFVVAAIVAAIACGAGGYFLLADDGPPPAQRAQPRAPVADPAAPRFAQQLDTIVQRLDGVRVSGRKRLARAKTRRGQASTARAIAAGYRRAAASLQTLEPAAAQRAAAARAHDELVRAGRAYSALATAASAGRRTAFNARRGDIAAREAAVRDALAQVPRTPVAP